MKTPAWLSFKPRGRTGSAPRTADSAQRRLRITIVGRERVGKSTFWQSVERLCGSDELPLHLEPTEESRRLAEPGYPRPTDRPVVRYVGWTTIHGQEWAIEVLDTMGELLTSEPPPVDLPLAEYPPLYGATRGCDLLILCLDPEDLDTPAQLERVRRHMLSHAHVALRASSRTAVAVVYTKADELGPAAAPDSRLIRRPHELRALRALFRSRGNATSFTRFVDAVAAGGASDEERRLRRHLIEQTAPLWRGLADLADPSRAFVNGYVVAAQPDGEDWMTATRPGVGEVISDFLAHRHRVAGRSRVRARHLAAAVAVGVLSLAQGANEHAKLDALHAAAAEPHVLTGRFWVGPHHRLERLTTLRQVHAAFADLHGSIEGRDTGVPVPTLDTSRDPAVVALQSRFAAVADAVSRARSSFNSLAEESRSDEKEIEKEIESLVQALNRLRAELVGDGIRYRELATYDVRDLGRALQQWAELNCQQLRDRPAWSRLRRCLRAGLVVENPWLPANPYDRLAFGGADHDDIVVWDGGPVPIVLEAKSRRGSDRLDLRQGPARASFAPQVEAFVAHIELADDPGTVVLEFSVPRGSRLLSVAGVIVALVDPLGGELHDRALAVRVTEREREPLLRLAVEQLRRTCARLSFRDPFR